VFGILDSVLLEGISAMQLVDVERNFSSSPSHQNSQVAAVCPWGNLGRLLPTVIREFPIFYAFHHWILIRLFLRTSFPVVIQAKVLFVPLIFFKG